jgi:hypothetical protein
MPQTIPISAIKKFAKDNGLTVVVALGWDGKLSHVLTYGDTIVNCDKAAIFGDKLKDYLGWPESLHAEPSRVKELKKENIQLKSEVALLKAEVEKLQPKKVALEYLGPNETIYDAEQRLGRKLLQEW